MDLSESKGEVVAAMIAIAAVAVLILARCCGDIGEMGSPALALISEDEEVTTESFDENSYSGNDATNKDGSADDSLETEEDASDDGIESSLQESPAVVDSDGQGSLSVARRQQDAITAQHKHTWVAQTEQRWVRDSAAWDEPVYSSQTAYICNNCGADITFLVIAGSEKTHFVRGSGCGSWHSEQKMIQTGTTHHEASGHYETVTAGYICSGCGASK